MAIIKQYHKDTDTTYVYESTSYWDADKKQSRSRRKCIGKIDPETGDIVPTGKKGRKKKSPGEETAREADAFKSLYEQARKENLLLKKKIDALEKTCQELSGEKDILDHIRRIISKK